MAACGKLVRRTTLKLPSASDINFRFGEHPCRVDCGLHFSPRHSILLIPDRGQGELRLVPLHPWVQQSGGFAAKILGHVQFRVVQSL